MKLLDVFHLNINNTDILDLEGLFKSSQHFRIVIYCFMCKLFANSINTDSDFSSNEIDTMTKTYCVIRLNLPCICDE